MIQKLKLTLLSITSLLMFSAPLAVSGVAVAQVTQDTINTGICAGSNVDFTGGTTDCGTNSGTTANNFVSKVINILSLLVGAVAVIMLIVGGFRYVTSGGKQESVAGAKNTIIYALIGLVIVAVAQLVVHFVLNTTTTSLA